MSVEEKSQSRYRKYRVEMRQYIQKRAAKTTAIIVALPIILSLLVHFSNAASFSAAYWATAAFSLVVAGWYISETFLKEVRNAHKVLRRTVQDTKNETIKELENRLDPTIYQIGSLNELQTKVAELIDSAVNESENGSQELVIVGSAAITPSDQEIREAISKDQDSDFPGLKYKRALERAMNSKQLGGVTRYVRFFDVAALASRSPKTQRAYLDWLLKQKDLLEKHQFYTLGNARRASRWGTGRTTYYFKSSFIDVMPGADGGLLVRGKDIAHRWRDAAVKAIEATSLVENKPKLFKQDDMPSLIAHIHEVKTLIDGKKND